MKRLVAAIAFMLAASPLALAQDKPQDARKKAPAAAEKSAKREPTEKQKAHQARMKACTEQAKGKKGEERKKFMSACLKG